MTKVVSISELTPPDQVCEEAVRLAETMLEKAKSGEIRSVAIVGVTANGMITSCWHSEGQYYTLLGAASWLAHRMNAGEK